MIPKNTFLVRKYHTIISRHLQCQKHKMEVMLFCQRVFARHNGSDFATFYVFLVTKKTGVTGCSIIRNSNWFLVNHLFSNAFVTLLKLDDSICQSNPLSQLDAVSSQQAYTPFPQVNWKSLNQGVSQKTAGQSFKKNKKTFKENFWRRNFCFQPWTQNQTYLSWDFKTPGIWCAAAEEEGFKIEHWSGPIAGAVTMAS